MIKMDIKNYNLNDFKVIKGEATQDKRIAYIFKSKDNVIEANFFWLPSNVETRGLIWKKDLIVGTFEMAYPFANYKGDGVLPKNPDNIIMSIINRLNRGEYKLVGEIK